MDTQCTPVAMGFHDLERREVIGKFDGGRISSDGGGVLLREIEKRGLEQTVFWAFLTLPYFS